MKNTRTKKRKKEAPDDPDAPLPASDPRPSVRASCEDVVDGDDVDQDLRSEYDVDQDRSEWSELGTESEEPWSASSDETPTLRRKDADLEGRGRADPVGRTSQVECMPEPADEAPLEPAQRTEWQR